jgi:hypothetical protein
LFTSLFQDKEVNGFSFAEKVGQSPIEKITKRLFEAQLFRLVYSKILFGIISNNLQIEHKKNPKTF